MKNKKRLISTTKSADDFLSNLVPKHFKQVFVKLWSLKDNPLPNDSKKLSGFDKYRVDSGEYRIIYTFDDHIVTIEVVGKRNDDEVYKKLKK